MNEGRDRFLTESMGGCWHDYDLDKPINTYSLEGYVCEKCRNFILGNYDFSTDEDFTRLWTWAKSQDALRTVVASAREQDFKDPEKGAFNRDSFADMVYSLLKK
jgi:hypothetical protein